MVFNDFYACSRPEVRLSSGAVRPSDFDEHLKALEYYDSMETVVDLIEKRLRDGMGRVLDEGWCS